MNNVVILKDCYLKYDVMIGREILSHGFGVVMTVDKFNIFLSKTIDACSVTGKFGVFIDNDIKLDVCDKERLLQIVKEYSIIDGIPQTRVNSGQLAIRLIDSNKTVQRLPYRLSSEVHFW